MNYLKTIKEVKNYDAGVSRKTAAQVCKLIKDLANCMYGWDMCRDTYTQWSVIGELAENIEQMYE